MIYDERVHVASCMYMHKDTARAYDGAVWMMVLGICCMYVVMRCGALVDGCVIQNGA